MRHAILDPTIAEELFGDVGGKGTSSEKRLMYAVLVDAIIHLAHGDATGIEARRWIKGGAFGTPAITFQDTCEALGFDRDYLARGILAWVDDPLAHKGPRRTPRRRRVVQPRMLTPCAPRRTGTESA
jgi:hypothetical protein